MFDSSQFNISLYETSDTTDIILQQFVATDIDSGTNAQLTYHITDGNQLSNKVN